MRKHNNTLQSLWRKLYQKFIVLKGFTTISKSEVKQERQVCFPVAFFQC